MNNRGFSELQPISAAVPIVMRMQFYHSFRESFWQNKDLSDLVRSGELFGGGQKLFQHKREHIDRFQNQLFPMADIAL